MDEIVRDFLIESNENLERLDQELVKLEAEPSSKELLASIFRTIHTIKGSCGFLGFARLEKVTHAGESLLSRLRDGEVALTEKVTSGLLTMVDAVRHMLGEIQATESDGGNDYPELREALKRLQSAQVGEESKAMAGMKPDSSGNASPTSAPARAGVELRILEVTEPTATLSPAASTAFADAEQVAAAAPPEANTKRAAASSGDSRHRPAAGKIGGLLVERGSVTAEQLAVALQEQEQGDQRRLREILVALSLCKPEDILAAEQVLESRGREAGVETIRVGVHLLDKLMNLVGELVLARNQLLQFSNTAPDTGL